LGCWYQSRLRSQEANIARLTSQPGSARDSGISIVATHQSLPTTRPVCIAAQPASHRTVRLAARPDKKKKASQPLLSPHRTVRLAAWHSAGTPGFRQLAATHYGPFQGQQTPQPTDYDTITLSGPTTPQQASRQYENFAWLPGLSVTLIVYICYSGCLRT
jgi:hypothetical protein